MATGDRYLATFIDLVQHNPNLDGTDVLVFLEILCLASKSGKCTASYKRIAEGSKCSASSVYRSVALLVKLNYIRVEEVSAKRPLIITPHPGFYRTKERPHANKKLCELQQEVSKKKYYQKKDKKSTISAKFQGQNENTVEDPFLRERSSKTDCSKIDDTETSCSKIDDSGTVKFTTSCSKIDALILSDRTKNINKNFKNTNLTPEQFEKIMNSKIEDWPSDVYLGFSFLKELPSEQIEFIKQSILHTEIDKSAIKQLCIEENEKYRTSTLSYRTKEAELVNKRMSMALNGQEKYIYFEEDDQELL